MAMKKRKWKALNQVHLPVYLMFDHWDPLLDYSKECVQEKPIKKPEGNNKGCEK
jgi:hypothetical protein